MKKVNIFALCGLLFGIMACSSEGEKHADVTLSTILVQINIVTRITVTPSKTW